MENSSIIIPVISLAEELGFVQTDKNDGKIKLYRKALKDNLYFYLRIQYPLIDYPKDHLFFGIETLLEIEWNSFSLVLFSTRIDTALIALKFTAILAENHALLLSYVKKHNNGFQDQIFQLGCRRGSLDSTLLLFPKTGYAITIDDNKISFSSDSFL